MANTGKVVQVIGSTLDAEFAAEKLPKIFNAIEIVKPGGKEKSIKIGGFIQGQVETGDAPDARYAGIEDRALLRRAGFHLLGIGIALVG